MKRLIIAAAALALAASPALAHSHGKGGNGKGEGKNAHDCHHEPAPKATPKPVTRSQDGLCGLTWLCW